jgi:tetratricopeptide (TPR) repeat protein
LLLLAGISACQRGPLRVDPRAQLQAAWTQFRLNEFADAEQSFAAALGHLSGDDPETIHLRANAIYGLALLASLAHHDEDPAQSARARELFGRVIALAPKSDEAAWSALAIIRDEQVSAAFDNGDIAAADKRYGDFITQYPCTPAAEEAFVDQMALHVQTGDPSEESRVVTAIKDHLRGNPDTPEKSALYHLLSKAHYARREFSDALAAAVASVNAKEIDPNNPAQNNISEYYRIGMMAQYDVGDFATARKYYALFLKEYPRDLRAFNVKRMLQHLDATEAALRAGKTPPTIDQLPPTEPITAGEGGAS